MILSLHWSSLHLVEWEVWPPLLTYRLTQKQQQKTVYD